MIGVDLTTAIRLLQEDELVAIPTETVYGLAGNALSPAAVVKIFEVKNRPAFDPLIVHLSGLDQLTEWVEKVDPPARRLAEAFWPGPLTLLLPRRPVIPDLVTAGSPLVGIRVPDQPLTLNLLAALPFPLAAPSANPFGYISPTTSRHVEAQLGDKIPYILDGGPCSIGLESTIVGFPEGEPTIFRKGGVPVEAIESLLGPVAMRPFSTSNPQAPGMLKSHYAPHTPFLVGDIPELLARHSGRRIGLLTFRKTYAAVPPDHQIALSKEGDLAEAARRLFQAMRTLDDLPLEVILAEPAPEEGLGRAINDRLRRAAQ